MRKNNSQDSPIRLNKFLAERLGISRRAADNLIANHKVLVNDTPGIIGQRIDKTDKICYNKKTVPFTANFTYLILNKPVGYICSRRAQSKKAKTIYTLLPKKYQNLKTVGRLDKDSSGLIILTDDGDFAFQLTHPSFHKIKVYEVSLDSPLEPLHQQLISDFGINLPDGPSKLGLERLSDNRKSWRVTMSEGRNRQIRRTFSALGYTVQSLHRTNFGPYELKNLRPGEFSFFHLS